jgi:hypothetical protein
LWVRLRKGRLWGGVHEDISLRTIRKTRLLVVSWAFIVSILLFAFDIDVVSFQLVEHDHAFGTLDTLFRLVLAPYWGLSFPKSTGGGFDIGYPAVVAHHVFVGLTAAVGDPKTSADTTAWRALWQVFRDVEGFFLAVGSAGSQVSVKGRQKG